MSQRKFVFSQVMEFFPRWVLEKAVKEYKGDFHAKNLNTYSHCLHLIFGQMAGCKSLKDISLVLRSIKRSAYHLGIQTVVDPSSLSKANETRDYRIFEDPGMWLIRKVRPNVCEGEYPRCLPSRMGNLRDRLNYDTLQYQVGRMGSWKVLERRSQDAHCT